MDNRKLQNEEKGATPESDGILSDELLAQDLDDEPELDDLPV